MFLDPYSQLRLIEQERERALAHRALLRAARGADEGRPGLARSGITSFARVLRKAGSAAAHVRLVDLRRALRLTRSEGI